MLSITAVSAGAIDYLLKGSGCAGHEHESDAANAHLEQTGAEYLLASASKEPAGVWFGAGLSMIGMGEGQAATEEDVRAVFGHLRHPSSSVEDPVFLGRPPRTFAAIEARIGRAIAREPDAGEERRAEIANEVRADRRKAVGYYDLTFSPVKSVSVLWAALISQGRDSEAVLVARAHREAIGEAMAWAESEVAWTRVGYHGRTAAGRSLGRYERGSGLVWTRWDHRTNRACEPQLHSHVAVLNRVVTASDGQIRALDGKGFRAVKHGIDAIYAQAYEQRLTEWLGVEFEWRPDGRAREILGIDQQLLTEASTRRRDVVNESQRLVDEYRARHGVEPSPAVRTKLARIAALSTRDAKSSLGPGEQVRQWCAPRRVRLERALIDVAHRAGLARGGYRDQRNQPARTLDEALASAVEAVQAGHATWDVGLLQKAIADELAGTPHAGLQPLPALTARVLAEPQRFGIVLVSAPDPVPVPAVLQRGDGKSVFRPHHDERYTTTAQLSVENAIVAAARTTGASGIDPSITPGLAVELDSAGLGPDQVAAVIGIMSSGRAGDVLIGPAGTGKSHTVGVLAQTWRTRVGGRVLGLATSQIAAMELGDNGLEAMNTTRFLTAFTDVQAPGSIGDQLRRGDLVVLDEVGMTSTAELARITETVAAAGAKLLFTGDHEQLGAIGAGGMLNLLVADNGCYELSEVHRFTHGWERTASAGLRVGDGSVLDVYERHGRLVGGTIEDLTEQAVRAYLADTLTGRQSLLVVGANEQASELSGRIHDELVRLGHVHAPVVAMTRDGNPIGVGDLIQARRNDPTIRLHGAGMVTNRQTYRVASYDHITGVLSVTDRQGRVAHLPPDYVAEYVTLAYASTVHAAQGRTVDTCHALIEPGCGRRSAYVALTRGRQANTAYIVCERDPDGHLPEPLTSTARAQLGVVLSSIDTDTTAGAELARRAGIEESRSLSWVVTQWDLIAGEICGQRCTALVGQLLSPATAAALLAEPGYPRLVRALRGAEMAGHDPTSILTHAIETRSLFGANSISDVLRWRIDTATTRHVPEHETTNGWANITPPTSGPVGEYLTALAGTADDRQHELACRALADQPQWATASLGPAPADERDRGEWVHRAGIVAAYRDLRGLPDDAVSLGPAPPREQVLHRALWNRAHTAAGAPADQLDYTTATDTELHRMRETYRRAQAWAPYWVADELRDAHLAATTHQHDAILGRVEAQLHPPGTPERARADADIRTAQHLAAIYQARVEHLTVIDTARRQWHHDTSTIRTRAEHAGTELVRRGLPRDPAPPVTEQAALLELSVGREASASEPSRAVQTRPRPASTAGADLEPDAAATGQTGQMQLFDLTPDPRHAAAAGTLKAAAVPSSEAGRVPVTLAEALRQVQISTELRAQHQDWTEALQQLHHRTRTRSRDSAEDYLRRTHSAAEIDHEHNQDLDLGADY